MIDRAKQLALRISALVLMFALSIGGCASVRNTPKQDYVWAMWENCKSSGTFNAGVAHIDRVETDGRYWTNTTTGPAEAERPKMFACMQEQFKTHPYLDWLKARQASAPASSGVVPPAAATAALSEPVMVPVWKVGDEWEYAYKSPAASGTYIWSVDRLEVLDGTQHYVTKSGTRELFFRVSDLASGLERVDGVVVLRFTPARLNYSWPLASGKAWEQDNREERPVDRQTTNRNSAWDVEAEESVAVPAGTFRALKIVWRNRNTSAVLAELWYAPAIKQWVKIREVLANGVRERELISFKLH